MGQRREGMGRGRGSGGGGGRERGVCGEREEPNCFPPCL